LESTVVRAVNEVVHILRPGGITREQIEELLGRVTVVTSGESDAAGESARLTEFRGAGGQTEPSARNESVPTVQEETELLTGMRDSVLSAHSHEQAPRSPGVKYAHYAPQGEMLLVTGDDPELMVATILNRVKEVKMEGRKVGILSCTEHVSAYGTGVVLDCGSRTAPEQPAQRLYALLRRCDELGLDFIAAEGYPERGIGAALMNRMRKAAGGNEIRV
jgi:L-threonylcarbamoyladenylate synthase